ncbi:MAG: cupin domain-containing protein [Candidatus Korarchaeota archaeon]|nr:cupin domain-containing protein [Candidatus Korarchaeota archaeon]
MPRRQVEKPWGREFLIVDEPEYAAKILEMKGGKPTSLHFHPVKKETLYVVSGRLRVETSDRDYELSPGDELTIKPGTEHRLVPLEDTQVLEVSTQPKDDTVRVSDPYRRVRVERVT